MNNGFTISIEKGKKCEITIGLSTKPLKGKIEEVYSELMKNAAQVKKCIENEKELYKQLEKLVLK